MHDDIQTRLQRVAVMKAVATKLDEAIADERATLDEYGREDFEQRGGRGFDIIIDGEQVGTFHPVKTRGTKGRVDRVMHASDANALAHWLAANPDALAQWLAINPRMADDMAGSIFVLTGEVPDGCAWLEVAVPGEPGGQLKYMALKVDADKVAHACRGQLVAMAQRALEAGVGL